MPDKTKKELCKIITNLKTKIVRLEESVDYWKKEDIDGAKIIDIKSGELVTATREMNELKAKARDEFCKRSLVIGNLVNMIQGMVMRAADVDCLTTTGQIPKFLNE